MLRRALRGAGWIPAALFCLFIFGPFPTAARAQDLAACYRGQQVTSAYKPTSKGEKPADPSGPAARGVALEDTIRIEVTNLAALQACVERANKTLVLFLDSVAFPNVHVFPDEGGGNVLNADLRILHTEGRPGDPWERLLGAPGFNSRDVEVSVGPAGSAPIKSDVTVSLDPISAPWLLIWAILFGFVLWIFFRLARERSLLRNGLLDPEAGPAVSSFSLAKTQAAWWFFFVLASYLLIGIVTGDYSGSLNATALTLLGIGGATAVIGSVIDNGRHADLAKSLGDKRAEAAKLTDEIATLDGQIAVPPAGADVAQLRRIRTELEARRVQAEAHVRTIRGETTGSFFSDIVSDANGASFPRFQVVAWTLVLTLVFVAEVYRRLAMPTFDPTLLGLMGISSATYLGLKMNEPSSPRTTNP
jgi:hypothetical protein